MKLVNIGYGNMVNSQKVVSVVSPDAAPVKRLVQDTRDAGKLIDASCGKKTRSVIIAESGHIILSALMPETIQSRLNEEAENDREEEEDNE
ncbi:MAG: DUF370 domain-containing protein [Clostridia bacterium]|nr:DUF370 domain-containing protein [Clostridia bacterium]MBR4979610.1 DUF370 domain-containing protein [Clostridia bacterium]